MKRVKIENAIVYTLPWDFTDLQETMNRIKAYKGNLSHLSKCLKNEWEIVFSLALTKIKTYIL